jgi:hypothetical protein
LLGTIVLMPAIASGGVVVLFDPGWPTRVVNTPFRRSLTFRYRLAFLE